MAIRVLIADDHEVVRMGLRSMLSGAGVDVVAEASTGAEVLHALEHHDLDLVLLDVRMPEGDGLKILSRLKDINPDLPVLMISTFNNAVYMARSVALGALQAVRSTRNSWGGTRISQGRGGVGLPGQRQRGPHGHAHE